MNIEKRYKKDGTPFYLASDCFTDPLTGKRKRVSISFKSNTPRVRNQVSRDLNQKITDVLAEIQGTQKRNVKRIQLVNKGVIGLILGSQRLSPRRLNESI